MKHRKLKVLSKTVLIKGIVLVLLGIVHLVFSIFEFDLIKDKMPLDLAYQYILWFNGVGIFICFIGTVDLFIYKGVALNAVWAHKLSLVTSVFSAITGFVGVATFHWEPSPPYIILLCGLTYVSLLLYYKQKPRNKELYFFNLFI